VDVLKDFQSWVQANWSSLSRYAGALTGDRQGAHDVLVDALIEIGTKWARVEAMANPLAYVRKVVATTYLNDKRKTGRRRTFPVGLDIEVEASVPELTEALPARLE